jgi:hypothetical protein
MKKKPADAKATKAPKRRRFVAGLIEGKSMRRAALDAGYTESMADNAGLKILPGAREELKKELGRKVPHAKLVQRIVEGLNAKEIKLAQFQGKYTDKRHVVNYSERRRYAELAAKLLGYLVQKSEVGSHEEAPLNFSLNVHFRQR